MALLEVRGLTTELFRGGRPIRAVNDVSFSIEAGETLGLVGESGSGKSITSLSLLRMVPRPGYIAAGEVIFDGVDLLKLSERQMRKYRGTHLSMVLQDPMTSLNPVLTIGDQVGEGATLRDGLHGRALQERTLELLRAVDIPAPEARLNDHPHKFSGGMRQRVAGAIALSTRPRLLIADEPTTALDVTIQMQYLDLLQDIQRREGLAMLFVTHDLGVVAKMCDRVAVMYAGRIVEIGSVDDIFDHPSHPYTRALLKSIPHFDEGGEKLFSIEGQPPSLVGLPPQCSFLPRCPESFARCQAPEFPPEAQVSPGHCTRCWHYV